MTETKDELPRVITTAELHLGDTISRTVVRGEVPVSWDSTLVVQIKDGLVHLWRPYGVTADFSYTGGVIPYVGIETYSVQQDDGGRWTLHRRQELR